MRINIYIVQLSLAVAEWVFSDSFSFHSGAQLYIAIANCQQFYNSIELVLII